MVNFLDTQADARRFAALLDEYDRRLKALERSTQAAHTSIEGGAMDIYDADGNLKGSVGVQPDGGVALVPVDTAPPPTPMPPTIEPKLAGLVIGWDGTWDDSYTTPTDFSLIQVHIGIAEDFTPTLSTLTGTITAVLGGTVTVAVEGYDPVWVRLVAQNTASITSPPSTAVQGTPRQAVAGDLIDGIINETKLAADAVTEAKIALGAVNTTALADGAITSAKILAGAITAEKLTALAITAEKIASLAITTDKLSALSVTADKLAVNSVTASKIAAGSIDATHIKAGAITAELLDAAAINGKTITGATVQTAATGARVILDSARLRAVGSNGATISMDPNAMYPYIDLTSPDGTNKAVINVTGGTSDANIGINSGTFTDPDGTAYRWRTFFGNDFFTSERVIASSGQPVGGRLFLTKNTASVGSGPGGGTVSLGAGTATVAATTIRAAGVLRADNVSMGSATIIPVPDKPTSVTLTGGSIKGTHFRAFVTPITSVPGQRVVGVGATAVSSAGLTIWVYRTNDTPTVVDWMIVGED